MRGRVLMPLSTRGCERLMPTTPPQVRVPITGPSLATWIARGKMSPSDPARSLVSTTMRPLSVFAG